MAVIRNVNSAGTTDASGQSSLDVPVGDNADGDIIVVAWQRFSSASTQPTLPSGFSNGASGVTGFSASGFIYKVNSGGVTASPINITWGATNHICAQAYVIRGQHASPIGASNSGGSSSTKELAATTTTTTAANSLILHSLCNRAGVPMGPTLGVFQPLGAANTGDTECAGVSGAAYVAASGVSTPSFSWGIHAANSCNDVVLEIKSATGSVPVGMTPGRTVVEYNAGFGTLPAWKDPDEATIGITAIDGVNMGTQAVTVEYNRLGTEPFRTTRLYHLGATSVWEGGFESVALDLTGKILCVPWAYSRTATDARVGAKGCICVLVDSADNWVAYTLRSKADGWVANQRFAKYIKHGVTTELDSGGAGTFDISDLVYVGYFVQTTATSGESYLYVGSIWTEDGPTIFTGGSSAAPVTVENIARHLASAGQWPGINSIQGTKQYLTGHSHQIGDGTVVTTFKSTGQSFVFRDVDIDYALADAVGVGLTLKGSATCNLDMSSSITAGESQQNFTIDSGSSTSATYNLIGASFINLNWACEIAEPYSGASFSDCNLVELGGDTITGVTVANPTGTSAATVNINNAVLEGASISVVRAGTDASYHLALGVLVTAFEINGSTLSGTAVADKLYSAYPETTHASTALVTGQRYKIKTAGTTTWTSVGAANNNVGTEFTATGTAAGTGDAYAGVTITTDGAGTSIAAADVTTTTANVPVYIAAPQPTLSATVLANTRCLLWNRTTSAELDNTLVAGTSWSKIITSGASSNDNLTLYAFKEGYAEFSTSFLYSGADTTILVTQTVDPVVAAFRTEDSVTDYTTLTEYNIYAPTIYIQADDADGVSKISRLATFYNGVLTTEDGARYFRGGMSMISTGAVRVNKGTIELLLENVSATKSLRFSDEATRRLYTDDGTSIIAPSSVAGSIEYAYGGVPDTVETGVSGLTGPESAQLMALPSAATIVATAVDGATTLAESLRLANAVLGGKVSGASTGTESFRDLADTKNRVVATVDSSGNRTALTRDLT